jgi:hypothetical protein
MVYRGLYDEYAVDVENARVAVREAQIEYSKGRCGVDKVNKANAKLADTDFRYAECQGGRVPDNR